MTAWVYAPSQNTVLAFAPAPWAASAMPWKRRGRPVGWIGTLIAVLAVITIYFGTIVFDMQKCEYNPPRKKGSKRGR